MNSTISHIFIVSIQQRNNVANINTYIRSLLFKFNLLIFPSLDAVEYGNYCNSNNGNDYD